MEFSDRTSWHETFPRNFNTETFQHACKRYSSRTSYPNCTAERLHETCRLDFPWNCLVKFLPNSLPSKYHSRSSVQSFDEIWPKNNFVECFQEHSPENGVLVAFFQRSMVYFRIKRSSNVILFCNRFFNYTFLKLSILKDLTFYFKILCKRKNTEFPSKI